MAALCIFDVGRIEVVLGENIYQSSLSPEKFVLEKNQTKRNTTTGYRSKGHTAESATTIPDCPVDLLSSKGGTNDCKMVSGCACSDQSLDRRRESNCQPATIVFWLSVHLLCWSKSNKSRAPRCSSFVRLAQTCRRRYWIGDFVSSLRN